MARDASIQVSPEEYRFLRRFFRRQALPWVVGLALVAIAAARLAVPEVPRGVAPRIDEALARIATLERENAALRTELEGMGQRMPSGLERRIAAAESRLLAVERPAAPDRDAGDVADRVARVEERLASTASAQETVTRSNLTRLRDLEARVDSIEGVPGSVPAAPMP
ncbi:MAG TPA: hypothetical protein VFC77_08280 [Myxococcota bacterium]|nr:hypothetical protein [Myxococcota bacterium]